MWQAEDWVQETLLKVYKIKSSEPGRVLTISFLYTTAKNLFIDEKRRRRDTYCIRKIFMG
ncbi:RNA polymerase sigma factor [Rossellomorea vietnamensis]|uniref:RNA polymerase sigma factor n=1 Tax=Rossellomorea vietnamensis TaxID=218284 RepID=UPI003CF3063B